MSRPRAASSLPLLVLLLAASGVITPAAADDESDDDPKQQREEQQPPPRPQQRRQRSARRYEEEVADEEEYDDDRPDPPPRAPRRRRGPVTPATTDGALRTGLYADDDSTTVFRALAALSTTFGEWTVSATGAVDVISSASVDVRSSPLGHVDVVTRASGGTSTSGGTMSDRRLQATLGVGWKRNDGRAVNLTAAYADENDYHSLSGGVSGAFDVLQRNTTLLGGASFTYDWIGSVIDHAFARTLYTIGATVGVAQVLSPRHALRLRYDLNYASGYQASPYRNVRFGEWTTTTSNGQIVFANTVGPLDGLPETLPDTRLRHAAVLEWVASLGSTVGLYAQARLGHDSWGVTSGAALAELRVASGDWRVQAGYRLYLQTAADFALPKYTMAPASYSYFTSDKELGRELGHGPHLDVARVLREPRDAGQTRVLLDVRLAGMFYRYPDFPLLGSRAGVFLDVGVTWER